MNCARHFLSAATAGAAIALLAGVPNDAHAGIVTFQLTYSGVVNGNGATGTGFVSFDDAVLPNTAGTLGNVPSSALGIVDFGITITNASSGNGSFGLADFAAEPDGWVWQLSAPLDFSIDLVGQAGFVDFNWCASSSSCANPSAPGGSAIFTIATSGETGESLQLASMRVATHPIPEPGSLALAGIGLAALAGARKRKQA